MLGFYLTIYLNNYYLYSSKISIILFIYLLYLKWKSKQLLSQFESDSMQVLLKFSYLYFKVNKYCVLYNIEIECKMIRNKTYKYKEMLIVIYSRPESKCLAHTPKSSNQNAVFIGYDILIGWFSSMSTKLESLVTIRTDDLLVMLWMSYIIQDKIHQY